MNNNLLTPDFQRIIVGYHGCDYKIATSVLLGKNSLKKSDNKYDWLGEGVYFWEYGAQRALEFAQEQKERGKINTPCVLGAYIHLGHCFDLTDTRYTWQLSEAFGKWKNFLKKQNLPMPDNLEGTTGKGDLVLRYRDCALINWYLKYADKEYQTVRGVFVEGKPAFIGSKLREKTHIQIAVRNSICILGYFMPSFIEVQENE